jgi:HEPN domain-containing protein
MTILDMAQEWLMFANNDLISARHLFEDLYPKQTNIAVYLCQQCAEKALKAFLVLHDRDPPKIHDLEKLIHLCETIDTSFSEIELHCKKINPYGAASRYPREIFIDEVTAQALIERAHEVYAFSAAKIHP